MMSSAFARFVVGPVGSGKTTGMIMEILRRAIEQAQGPDGVRHTRFAIVRQTLLQLKMTVLLDVMTWLRPVAEYKVSEQLVRLKFADVDCEIFLIPMEDEDDQKRLLSMQLTGCFISECIEIDPGLVAAISGRCGRYPSAADGGCTWFGVFGDTNAPTEGSEWWKLFEDQKPPDWQIFFQPGGLEPLAENLEWLTQTAETLKLPLDDEARRLQGRKYYERLARGHNADWIKRYVHAKYGNDPSGSAVFRGSFRRNFHVVASLDPVLGYPLLVGQDFGRNPCSIICQPDSAGRLLCLEEVIADSIGLESHVLSALKPKLWTTRYMGLSMAAVGDPSGRKQNDHYEEDSFDLLNRLGIPSWPAPTNDIDPRILAVETLLLQQRGGGPALVIDEQRCPTLVRALNQFYRYGITKAGTQKAVPDKNHPWSDIVDALQYVCLTVNSGLSQRLFRRIMPKVKRPVERRVSAAGWT